ncbi:MAG TPA: CehA/McbA family metallohydrolase [Terriglobales bacterium]
MQRNWRLWFIVCLIIFCRCWSNGEEPPTTQPDLVLNGVLTHEDHQTYRMLPFTVPEGVYRITVEFSYTGREQHTTVDLGLADPAGFRGWSGGGKHTFTISESDATPSYLAGPIRAGVWKLILGIPNIRPDVRSEYKARIFFFRSGAAAPEEQFSKSLRSGPAWYRGDLHMHTAHSDGSCESQSGKIVPCPVFLTLQAATNRGLDFIAITDHNTISQYDSMRELAPYFDRLLLLFGREITTFQGHANVYGTSQFIDFRVGSPEVPEMSTLLQRANKLGAMVSINHPMAPSGEQCLGCGWHPQPDADLHLVQAVEAVNSMDSGTRYSGLPFWEAQLNRGYRLTAIAGSDNHRATKPLAEQGSIGAPTTVVYATELSAPAVLEAIRAGHVFIDVAGSRDRLLELTANADGRTATMGDVLPLASGVTANFTVHVANATGSNLEIIEDGKPLTAFAATLKTEDTTTTFSVRGDSRPHWIRAGVRSSNGKLLLLGNPIYLNFKKVD